MTTSRIPQIPVLIVGAGPVGLALACELGLRGVPCLLVEKRDGRVHVPKMSLVSAGSMELCRRWGIAGAVRTAVWSETHSLDFVYVETLTGRELTRLRLPAYAQGRPEWSAEGMCHCPQIYFDPILAERIGHLADVQRRYLTSLVDFAADDHGVTATLVPESGDPSYRVRADYLVGCDGAAGIVRQKLGIANTGLGAIANSVNIFFRSPELASLHDKGWARMYRTIDEAGCWAELIPIDGHELWRLTVFDDPRYEHEPDAALLRMMGKPFPYAILSTLLWERRDTVAARYGDGRVLIAGDSAHQSSPTGGAGMHTGIEEAVNLGWKLEAMVKGWGGPGLISSYEAERKPIAERNIELSTATYHALRSIPPAAEAARTSSWRDDMSPYSIPDFVRSYPSFASSPICVDDGTPPLERAPRTYKASTRPGARAPHAWLADGRSILDLYGDSFVLLRLGANPPDAGGLLAAAQRRGVPMREVVVADSAIAELYQRPLVLVRPDFHVAWRGARPPSNPDAVIAQVVGAG
jgi:2-polyprenyl-6-methoxyphenol hydroxylase-like FAD-dependent oxidoreductase